MKAIYAGTFDPITTGHVEIIRQASRMFDHLYVVIAENKAKQTMFTATERLALVANECIENGIDSNKVTIVIREGGLLVDVAKEFDCSVFVRGVRLVTDFDYELGVALNNNVLGEGLITTVWIPPCAGTIHISSSVVRELVKFGYTGIADRGYVSASTANIIHNIMKERAM